MPEKSKQEKLQQHWMHSREEDTPTEMVFRPATYDFPLTRSVRESFELKPDGSFVKGGPSPTDRQQEGHGTWKLEGDDRIAFYTAAQPEPSQTLQIAAIAEHRLTVKKPG